MKTFTGQKNLIADGVIQLLLNYSQVKSLLNVPHKSTYTVRKKSSTFSAFRRHSEFFVVFQKARTGEKRGLYRVLVGKPEGKRPLGRPRRRWVDNIRMDLQEVGCGYVDWIGLAQDRDRWRTLVSAVMNLRIP